MPRTEINKAQVTFWVGRDGVEPIKATFHFANISNGCHLATVGVAKKSILRATAARFNSNMVILGGQGIYCLDSKIMSLSDQPFLKTLKEAEKAAREAYADAIAQGKGTIYALEPRWAAYKNILTRNYEELSKYFAGVHMAQSQAELKFIVRVPKQEFRDACFQAIDGNKHIDLTAVTVQPNRRLTLCDPKLTHQLKQLVDGGERQLVEALHAATIAALKP